jgi:lysophospholipase L1-like esterase
MRRSFLRGNAARFVAYNRAGKQLVVMAGTRHKFIQRTGTVLRCGTALFILLTLFVVISAIDLSAVDISFAALQVCVIVVCVLLLLAVIWPRQPGPRIRQRLFLLSLGCFIGLVLVEAYFRVVDPFPMLLRGGRIYLPIHFETELSGHGTPGLDDRILVTYNSIGFRGPEPPEEWGSHLTIVCVGGSTTQCGYLSDGKTWPDQLAIRLSAQLDNIWVNNAGLDGHSTFGHLHLVDQYVSQLRPQVALFLVGANDVGRADLNRYDRAARTGNTPATSSLVRAMHNTMLERCDVYAVVDNLRRQRMARKRGLMHDPAFGHGELADVDSVSLTDEQRAAFLRSVDQSLVTSYKRRLVELVTLCRKSGIRAVLVTQPVLYGEGLDEALNVNLENVAVADSDGSTQWKLLQQYNKVTTEVGSELGVPVIGLGEQLPKLSQFYYDLIHYNNHGAAQVASLIAEDLAPMLQKWYPEFSRVPTAPSHAK